jgi:hypothetical protein
VVRLLLSPQPMISTRKLAIVVVVLAAVLALGALTLRRGASAAVPGAAQARASQTPSDIDSLLAPIALYPDALLAQILVSAMDPQGVVRLSDWLKANSALKGTELQDGAVLAGFEPNLVALALFPQVVTTMASKLDWTTLVGQMFAADKKAVFASIQKLRGQAQSVGTLKSNEQQQIETQTTSSGEQVIVIEPTNPQIIYVPQYNPTVVYTQPVTTTVVVDNSASAAAAGAMVGFTAGIVIGAAVNNNYYYGPYGWHGGGYMYNDAWDDYMDHREDAREDWQDHREDLAEERGDRAKNGQEERTDRQENRQENRPESQAQRDQRKSDAQGKAQQRQASGTQAAGAQAGTQSAQSRTPRSSGAESRGYSGSGTAATASADRSGTRSDAFSGYSSGKSERAASDRGRQSRGSSGGGSRSRSGGGGGGRRR